MSDARPIGLLDSGVGGLSVLREVRRLLPAENLLYVADQAHLPYGPRPVAEVRAFVEAIARFLLAEGCKMLVLPCVTANAAALGHLRATFPTVPVVGMEPAVKPAAERTRTGVIGVISTQATNQSALFASVVDRFAQNVRVVTGICPEMVTLAEQGAPDTPEARAIIATYLAPLQAEGIDMLVLACTHFPFLDRQISDFLGPAVTLIDPAPAVARQCQRVLEARGLRNEGDAPGLIRYLTTGEAARFAAVREVLLGAEAVGSVGAARWEDGVLWRAWG
jgi:glutamate racemase